MTLIDFGDFKLRFDPKEVRISIDGDLIDVGARREQVKIIDDETFINIKNRQGFIEEKYCPDGKGGYDLGIKKKSEDTDISEKWTDDVMDIHDKFTGKTKSSRL